ncbi:NAD(P)/FAD-dependent oxidoreductase [Arundinibacter roseus]|uniref:FAD-dependent oxidoreductase n=1 Tax=Arundinibacter roseus TaxID=2070510 RepID=A0A4R4KDP6_9BACT|nr:FAD-dependent oxidoreductase [Arundinibacter roseus]TDB66067.1 FAD-dependent oxidoreductase [Arundinibacter roseus]
MPSCIIIGAGMAGLTAAHELQKHGWDATVLDKGRGVGGRMATRRLLTSRADHGAQYFSVRTPDFRAHVQQLLAVGVVKEWNLQEADFEHPRYIGSEGMSTVPKYMAEGLSIKTGERVVRLEEKEGGVQVRTDTGHLFSADAVILTIPAPQAYTLLRDSAIELAATELSAFSTISYQPCLAVMVVLKQPTLIPAPGVLNFKEGNIAWIADNYQKGIANDPPTVTIHASPTFSRENLEGDLMELGQHLLGQLTEWIPAESIADYQVHRWRYSLADKRFPQAFVVCNTPYPMLMGGDGFGMGNVEGAFQSGLQMARQLAGTK